MFEQEWFFQSTLLAQNELLETSTLPLDYRKVIARAKEIYSEGLLMGIKELFDDKKVTVTKPTSNQPTSGFKICPGCGEEIPVGWKKHSRKKDGSVCGHEF